MDDEWIESIAEEPEDFFDEEDLFQQMQQLDHSYALPAPYLPYLPFNYEPLELYPMMPAAIGHHFIREAIPNYVFEDLSALVPEGWDMWRGPPEQK